MHVMIFGAGYSGKAIGGTFLTGGNRVSGTTRTLEKTAALAQLGINPFLFDGEVLDDSLRSALKTVTHLVQSIAPGATGDPLLKLGADNLRFLMPDLRWAAYLSTVGIYGDHDGAVVTEDSECRPVSVRSHERIAAEKAWLAAGNTSGIPVAILRLSGIYGPGRNGFVNLDKGTARRVVKKDQVFNRIRVEDIAAATLHLSRHELGGIYNVTDDEPAPPQDVVTQAARLMGVEPPAEQPIETVDMTPMAASFWSENKRVSNDKIRATGFQFSYPDYRVSLDQLWTSGRWKA